MVKNANNYACNSTHIYEADVILKDIDVFVPQGYMEYRQAQWNGEDHTNTQPLVPEPLQISSELQVHVASNDISKFALDNYLNLPLCTEPDSEGRWIPIDAIPFDKSHLPKQDNFERVWLPYNCRLYPYSYEEFAECTSKKHNLIHWFGDSNTRRALKKISSMGSWCSKPDEVNTQLCKCNDNVESLGQQDPRLPMIPINIGPHSKIMHFRWGGLTQINNPPWLNTFSSDFANITDTPSLAIFALVNWDVAFSTRSFFIQQVEILLDKITEYYPSASTEIIVRTGQYYCCAYDQDIFWKRKFSRLRTLYFNQYITQAFQKRFGNEQRVSIWDVSQLSERRPYKAREEAAQTCAPNHARAELVDIENQLLFNRLCN
ncbi:hypothetical protein LPJ68_004209 [Coemansia sp. RSA 1086]|nr:hypothetical protein LPJ68_004209 [Coemansia sp. RSA 1086]